MKLSVLICHIPSRAANLGRLKTDLYSQMLPYDGIEVLVDGDTTKPIGRKRNELLEKAQGEYVCFIDDDDMVSGDYVKLIMEGIQNDVDCCSLKGFLTADGVDDGVFEHSLKYDEWRTTGNEVKYERYPNHLNVVRASIAKQFKYPETNFGEDHDWSKQVHNSGQIQTEHYIPEIIYYYRYVSNKN